MQLFNFLLLAGAVAALFLASVAWTRRRAPGAPALLAMQLSAAWWLTCYALPFARLWPDDGLFLRTRVIFPAVVTIAPLTLMFVLSYTRGTNIWRLSRLLALGIMPAAVLGVALSPLHDLLFGTWRGVATDSIFQMGPLFWVHSLYSYVLVGAAVLALVAAHERGTAPVRRQTRVLMGALVVPIVCNTSFIAGVSPPDIDPTPLGLVASGMLVSMAIFRRGLFDLVSVAYEQMGAAITDGFIVVDAQRRIVESNAAIRKIFGVHQPARPGQHLGAHWPELDTRVARAGATPTTTEFVHGDAQHLELRTFAICDDGDILGYVLIVRDVTDARTTSLALEQANAQLKAQLDTIQSMQAQLQEQVIRDPLTGLYNRLYLADALARELTCSARTRSAFAVVMIDVDHFKSVNDVHGHAVGDAILRSLGGLLRQQVRPTDSPCRYGGEEFVVIMRDVTLDLAIERINELRVAFSALRFAADGVDVSRTFSAGVALFPSHGHDEASLLAAADAALYAAKAAGRNRVCQAVLHVES
jgi:diguanylate cyclase (GGDEF)-like protein/PAS domain S-box-containing protein